MVLSLLDVYRGDANVECLYLFRKEDCTLGAHLDLRNDPSAFTDGYYPHSVLLMEWLRELAGDYEYTNPEGISISESVVLSEDWAQDPGRPFGMGDPVVPFCQILLPAEDGKLPLL